jgi:hypothetical protein
MNKSLRERILRNDEVRLMLSRRANEFYRLRGCEPGRDVEDWSRAEGEILAVASLVAQEMRYEIESGKLVTDAGSPKEQCSAPSTALGTPSGLERETPAVATSKSLEPPGTATLPQRGSTPAKSESAAASEPKATDAPTKRRGKSLKKGKVKEIAGTQSTPASTTAPVRKAGQPSKGTD